MATRYFLNADGSLRAEAITGRCERWWQLWQVHEDLEQEVIRLNRHEVDPRVLKTTVDQMVHAEERCITHLQICDTCRCWMDECGLYSLKEANRAKQQQSISVPGPGPDRPVHPGDGRIRRQRDGNQQPGAGLN